ncbi:MAG: HAD-IIB family hydrolase [Akkermansiaceae bacterium]|nr:HAD-IIB family hydrolase [Akkermansiaceae bacterium]
MVPPPSKKVLVVTDLDGSLLDHYDYSHSEVLPVLERLATLGIPVVANTSKTRGEWFVMRDRFSNEVAFVVENGSAVIFPDREDELLRSSREEINLVLDSLREEFYFETFQDPRLTGLVEHTGLAEVDAVLASKREFSEPLVWKDLAEQEQRFCEEIPRRGLTTLVGGLFLRVLGTTNKGKALKILRPYYGADFVIALGDSPNDVTMLDRVEVGCIILTTSNTSLLVSKAPHVFRSEGHGPSGWADDSSP